MVRYLKNIGQYVNDDKEANANTFKEKLKGLERTQHLMMSQLSVNDDCLHLRPGMVLY